jgi:hypothetical protein
MADLQELAFGSLGSLARKGELLLNYNLLTYELINQERHDSSGQ